MKSRRWTPIKTTDPTKSANTKATVATRTNLTPTTQGSSSATQDTSLYQQQQDRIKRTEDFKTQYTANTTNSLSQMQSSEIPTATDISTPIDRIGKENFNQQGSQYYFSEFPRITQSNYSTAQPTASANGTGFFVHMRNQGVQTMIPLDYTNPSVSGLDHQTYANPNVTRINQTQQREIKPEEDWQTLSANTRSLSCYAPVPTKITNPYGSLYEPIGANPLDILDPYPNNSFMPEVASQIIPRPTYQAYAQGSNYDPTTETGAQVESAVGHKWFFPALIIVGAVALYLAYTKRSKN